MQCRRCEALSQCGAGRGHGVSWRTPLSWGAERIHGLQCVRCDALLGVEDIAQLLHQKHSQLAQFGLVSPRPPRPLIRLEED